MKGSGIKRRCVEVKHEMKYISLLNTLERLLQSKTVLKEVISIHVYLFIYITHSMFLFFLLLLW